MKPGNLDVRPTHPRFGRVPQIPQHGHSRRIINKHGTTSTKGIKMKLPTGSTAVLGSVLAPALLTFSHRASGQHSCIQTIGATFSGYPCDAAQFSFSIIREISLAKNTVSILDN